MAITYPRQLPDYHLTECWAEYQDNSVTASSGKGLFLNTTRIAKPSHKLYVVTGLLDVNGVARWSSWYKSLRSTNSFLAQDVRRRFPLFYPGAKQPSDIAPGWSGLATVTSIGLSGLLGLSGLPANYKFHLDDRIGLEQNGHYGYYSVIEEVTASAGGVVTVNVAPLLHDRTFTTAAVARIWRPVAKYRLDWTTWKEPGEKEPGAISFTGVQKL